MVEPTEATIDGRKSTARRPRKGKQPAIEDSALAARLRQAEAARDEALAQQAATAEILQIINRSSGDATPVFQAIVERAMRLCDAPFGGLLVPDGEYLRYLALGNAPPRFAHFLTHERIRLGTMLGPAVLAGETLHVADLSQEEGYRRRVPVAVSAVEDGGIRSLICVPLIKEGAFIGAFTLYRQDVRPFAERQIALARSFADQAAIAMENARLLDEINTRNRDLEQSLERQTATSEILGAIAAAPGDAEGTLRKIAETTARLFGATGVSFRVAEGDEFKWNIGVGDGASEIVTQLNNNPAQRPTVGGRNMPGTVVRENRQIHIPDLDHLGPEFADWPGLPIARAAGIRAIVGTPLRAEGRAIGAITVHRNILRPFEPFEMQLLQGFADQAVIAIENARLLTELRESLDRQTATADILRAIASTPGDPTRALDTIAETALRMFGASNVGIRRLEGDMMHYVATAGGTNRMMRERMPARSIDSPDFFATAARENRQFHVPDLQTEVERWPPEMRDALRRGGVRTAAYTPLTRDGKAIGTMGINRTEIRPFLPDELELMKGFADQAVIAIENARLLTELRESLEQQQAIAEVLQVINASPGNLQPVFDAILDKAHSLCGANIGWLLTFDGELVRTHASRGLADLDPAVLSTPFLPGPAMLRLIEGESFLQIPDIGEAKDAPGTPLIWRASCELLGTGNYLVVPLRKDGAVRGFINAFRSPIRLFSENEIALLQSFAAQAVIAMDNARLLGEIRQRQAELRVTFDNMGDAVIMFDGEQRLVAWNLNFLHMLDIPEEWLASPRSYADFAAYLTTRGEFGDTPPPDLGGPARQGDVRPVRYERTRPDGRMLEVRRNPIPGGAGFVFIYSDITERKLAERGIMAAREAAERALAELKLAQANLIQAEKMASLGQLTAGIAHEIKNPLNFVNNFASLSNELLGELKETAAPAFAALDADTREEIDETMTMLTGNLEKIQEHGKRADGIVKSMLAHSRGGSGDRREADINALVEESLNLAYHGARAQDQNFNITLERDYDKAMQPIELVPQDVTRVFLNLCGNGFYAANKRRKEGGEAGFRPVLKVATKELGDAVEVRIRDNGTGIPPEVKDKLFQPFFTTKPTGEGTGLGLSISYDIVTQQHGGTIAVDSRVGDFTEFAIRLPRKR